MLETWCAYDHVRVLLIVDRLADRAGTQYDRATWARHYASYAHKAGRRGPFVGWAPSECYAMPVGPSGTADHQEWEDTRRADA